MNDKPAAKTIGIDYNDPRLTPVQRGSLLQYLQMAGVDMVALREIDDKEKEALEHIRTEKHDATRELLITTYADSKSAKVAQAERREIIARALGDKLPKLQK